MADNAATVREVFKLADVRVGDVIRYPAILKPEHGGSYGTRLVVVGIDGRGLRCLSRANGAKQEAFVTPAQVECNGVRVEGHVDA